MRYFGYAGGACKRQSFIGHAPDDGDFQSGTQSKWAISGMRDTVHDEAAGTLLAQNMTLDFANCPDARLEYRFLTDLLASKRMGPAKISNTEASQHVLPWPAIFPRRSLSPSSQNPEMHGLMTPLTSGADASVLRAV